jgi:hypothetical protein
MSRNFPTGHLPKEFRLNRLFRVVRELTFETNGTIFGGRFVATKGLGIKIQEGGRARTFVSREGGIFEHETIARFLKDGFEFFQIGWGISIITSQRTGWDIAIAFAPSARTGTGCFRAITINFDISNVLVALFDIGTGVVLGIFSITRDNLVGIKDLTSILAEGTMIVGRTVTASSLVGSKLEIEALCGSCNSARKSISLDKKEPKNTIPSSASSSLLDSVPLVKF